MDFTTADAQRRQILSENDPITAAVMLGQRFAHDPDFYAALHNREIAPGVHISNPGPDPAKMAERWGRKIQGAAQDYVSGMQNPKRDPVAAALRAEGKYKNRVIEAANEGRYGKGVRAQDYAEAVRIATEDGGSAFVAGATKRQAKTQRIFNRLAPLLGGVSQAIQNMPQDTDAQREQRLLAARKGMIAVGKQLRGGGG